MAKIQCPHCLKEFEIDKSTYDSLLNEIEKEEVEKRINIQIQQVEAKYKAEYALEANKLKANKDGEIAELKKTVALLEERLKGMDKDTELAVSKALETAKEEASKKESELLGLKSQLFQVKKQAEENAQKAKEQYEFVLKAKDEEIQRWKEFRMGDSTKDIGESLEQYCHDEFELNRLSSYPNAYFEKDNEVVGGTKGDFIYRDYTEEDKENEMVSIMFEMKNQKEDGDTKNETHLKKLDSDRTKKNCEYAVLVSTLEPESKLYNSGIVDMSHKYPKMFVVRPQFFLAIIGLIKTMAKTRFEYKKQVIQYQRENLDITRFEEAVSAVVSKVNEDYIAADKIYSEVDKMCDDIIKKVNTFRDRFKVARNHISTAINRLPNLEVRSLTKNNPTMEQKFKELEESRKGSN